MATPRLASAMRPAPSWSSWMAASHLGRCSIDTTRPSTEALQIRLCATQAEPVGRSAAASSINSLRIGPPGSSTTTSIWKQHDPIHRDPGELLDLARHFQHRQGDDRLPLLVDEICRLNPGEISLFGFLTERATAKRLIRLVRLTYPSLAARAELRKQLFRRDGLAPFGIEKTAAVFGEADHR